MLHLPIDQKDSRLTLLCLFLALFMIPRVLLGQAIEKKSVKLMGCGFSVTAVAETETIAQQAIEVGIQEMSRIENLISSWDSTSQTSEINRNAGIQAVAVDQELFDLIFRAKKVSALTQGAFDISFASIDWIWKFDQTEQVLPDSVTVKQSASKINWENIELNTVEKSVFLKEKGMKIGFGGIGKGYAANKAKEKMEQLAGVTGGVVNASGDLLAWGESPYANRTIQIADPKNQDKSLAWLELNDMSIVTSGNYEKFFMSNGQRYAHIVNPQTGYPTTGIKSVSIICPDAELADALATSIFVLGKENGLHLINQLNLVECLIVTDDDELIASKNLTLNYY